MLLLIAPFTKVTCSYQSVHKKQEEKTALQPTSHLQRVTDTWRLSATAWRWCIIVSSGNWGALAVTTHSHSESEYKERADASLLCWDFTATCNKMCKTYEFQSSFVCPLLPHESYRGLFPTQAYNHSTIAILSFHHRGDAQHRKVHIAVKVLNLVFIDFHAFFQTTLELHSCRFCHFKLLLTFIIVEGLHSAI